MGKPIKHYIDIPAFQTKFADSFTVGDVIQITEKVDRSNASITYNPETDSLDCYSRKHPLTPEMTLDGFYEYVQRLDKTPFQKYVGYRIFGEWLPNKHKIKYDNKFYKELYCFDVYDEVNERWMPQEFAIKMANDCGLPYVPILYTGPFISWEHVRGFMEGVSALGADVKEGVVVKNQDNLNNPNSRRPFVVKLVNTAYQESMKHTPKEPLNEEELAKRQAILDTVNSIVTENRVEKCLYKLIHEDQLIPEDWDSSHMGTIAKNLPRVVYNDCLKEEKEIVLSVDNFGKYCQSATMVIVRGFLQNQ